MLVLLALLVVPTRADEEGDFVFARIGGTAVLTDYTGPGGALVIPDRLGNLPVARITWYAFSGHDDLTSVTIPNPVNFVESEAFSRCAGLKAIEVDSLNQYYCSVDGVLFNKTQSQLVAYPASRAGVYAIPSSVTTIETRAFSGSTMLTDVTIPNSVIRIGEYAFSGCSGLTNVTIPNSIAFIQFCVFLDCTRLTSVSIPTSVRSIQLSAFAGCTSLTSIRIPGSVTELNTTGFLGCTSLMSFEVDPLNPALRSVDGVLFSKTPSQLAVYPAGRSGPYSVPDGVTSVIPFAFAGCKGLTSITIPDSVTSIKYMAIYDCTGLAGTYFRGNAPDAPASGNLFVGCDFVTVFHRAGTEGWGSTFGDRSTARWVPSLGYADWAASIGLVSQFPNANAEGDDPDGDGLANGAEWTAATDPTQAASRLELEPFPRLSDLSPSDQTPIDLAQHALYFSSVPGHYYAVQRAPSLGAAWELQATRIAAAAQTRILLPKPDGHAFYRVLAMP